MQSGYYLSGHQLEPAIRIARYDADLPAGGDAITTCTGGRNVQEVSGEPAHTTVQLMNQVYF